MYTCTRGFDIKTGSSPAQCVGIRRTRGGETRRKIDGQHMCAAPRPLTTYYCYEPFRRATTSSGDGSTCTAIPVIIKHSCRAVEFGIARLYSTNVESRADFDFSTRRRGEAFVRGIFWSKTISPPFVIAIVYRRSRWARVCHTPNYNNYNNTFFKNGVCTGFSMCFIGCRIQMHSDGINR